MRRSAFTLIELLAVVAIMSMLVVMLLPALQSARAQAQGVACRSNVRQLVIANMQYASDYGGRYCPGAARFVTNLDRWHGRRDHPSAAFDGRRGPLVPYLGTDGAIRRCPTLDTAELSDHGFERAAGGYGYNNAYLGVISETGRDSRRMITNDESGAASSHVARPAETLMFADTAFAGSGIFEYSFAEPRYHLLYPEFRADPSIHFRHAQVASSGWADGHVDARTRTFTWFSGMYAMDPAGYDIGWFGTADDNRLFDLD